ncbi:MAG TPA: hypothetical protein VF599_05690 [Pyrinomonadaceae bacterium]
MLELDNFHVYKDVLVSGVDYDFSSNYHENIPQRLYADWAALLFKLAKVVSPAFVAPPFPESLRFQTESIHSDGPYSADADYYILDYVYFELKAENECGLKISFENGRWGGDNPISMETSGFDPGVSSQISKEAKSPLASVYLWHAEEKSSAIAEIIARHQQTYLPSPSKWKTNRDTFLIQKNLKAIPFIYGGVGLEGGERFEDSAEYVETTASGQVVKRYGEPLPFSIEDEMTVSNIHRVIGDCLYRFYYSQRFMFEPELKTELLLSGLESYNDVLPFNEENLFD